MRGITRVSIAATGAETHNPGSNRETVTGRNAGMVDKENAPKRLHRATYARDKKKGGYLVRVAGPTAGAFAGREVPVTMLDKSEHMEKLVRLIWTGIDTGEFGGTAGEPIALYTFESHPREAEADTQF
jgi:hypothetical protein